MLDNLLVNQIPYLSDWSFEEIQSRIGVLLDGYYRLDGSALRVDGVERSARANMEAFFKE